ncbi:hypothetical protein D3C73_1315050 [compost metagenome]
MANSRNRLAGLVERLDQRQHTLIQAQVLRSSATRDQQGIVAFGTDLDEVMVQGKVVARLLAVRLLAFKIVDRRAHRLARDFLRAHRMHRVAHHAQGLERHHRLVVLDVVAHQHENLLCSHRIHSFGSLGNNHCTIVCFSRDGRAG